ncbi:MAG: glycoside hydrolase domain-containing protein [bacterium]
MPNGKQLKIATRGKRHKNAYVDQVLLNGRPITTPHVTHQQLIQGGQLTYVLK